MSQGEIREVVAVLGAVCARVQARGSGTGVPAEQGACSWDTDGEGSGGAGGVEADSGTDLRGRLSGMFLRVSAGEVAPSGREAGGEAPFAGPRESSGRGPERVL